MADTVSLEEQTFRGERAKQLLADPMIVEALQAIKNELIQTWEATPARDIQAREWLWMMHQASLRFESVFKGFIDTGKIAKDQLVYKQSLAARTFQMMKGH